MAIYVERKNGIGSLNLSIRGVELARGERVLLSHVNLEAATGDLIALLGPSGSGKTTLLRAIAGLDAFQRGCIEVGEARMEGGGAASREELRRLTRSVGFVFQFHCLFEHLSALQNVCLAPVHVARRPQHEAEQSGRQLLRELGVEARADAWPRALSGGEAQRVAIARALAMNPPVLLMDEPMASLDQGRRAELGKLLQRLAGAGRTLLVTTHDETFANRFANRILTIREGQVVEGSSRS